MTGNSIFAFNRSLYLYEAKLSNGTAFEDVLSVRPLQDNVVARPLNDAHLATLFNFREVGL